MKEVDIQRQVCDYLALRKHFFWRNNNTPIFDKGKMVFRAMPKYTMKGIPDIIIIDDTGHFIGLEIKKPKTYQSKEQKEFEARCKENGAEYYVIRKFEDLKEIGL